jgi:NAD(P)-dependent dehydrogenase (short-subunit alcohol dehydrogenase family)
MRDKVVIVTGATSGIGRASAILFAAQGAKVAAVGRNTDALADLERKITGAGGTVKTINADLMDDQGETVERIINETVEAFGGIDVLVNGAGTITNGTIETTDIHEGDKMMGLNVRAVFLMMQKSIPYLEKNKGNIVNISSVAGTRAFPNVIVYCISKAAVDQLTRCAALELAPKGIRVNAVNPGVVVTNIHKRGGMDNEKYAAFLEHSKTTHPLGRVGTAEEVAELIAFLASDKAGWITGATYEIDGGRQLTCAR